MKRFLLIVVMGMLLGCSSSDDTPDPDPDPVLTAPIPTVLDVANLGDASDFELSFTKPSNLEFIEEFRIFVVKTDNLSTFDSLTAFQATSEMYITIHKNSTETNFQLENDTRDVDDDLIVEGVSYNFFLFTKATEESGLDSKLSAASSALALQQKSSVRALTGFINSGSGGMDSDKSGNIYMGDFGVTLNGGGTRVFLISPQGQVSVFANGMNGASGNDFDSEGNLYQSSITGGYISKITPDGTVSTFVSGISSPIGIAINPQGTMYVAACNNTIWKISPDGNAEVFSTSPLLSCPNGIDLDDQGNIYTCNFNDGRVIKITPSGSASLFVTIPGNNNGHILYRDDKFYIAARGANQIYTISMSGMATLLAGTGSRGLDNGGLDEATFSLPNDLAFSPDGKKLYVNDKDPAATGNTISPVVIREIDLIN